jgi:hypothetical protein
LATDTLATIEVLLETLFSTQSMQRDYKEDNWGNCICSVWEVVKKWDSWKRVTVQRKLEPRSGGIATV